MISCSPGIFRTKVGIVRNCRKLGECQPPKESVVHCLKVIYLKLQVLYTDVFLSLKGHGKGNLFDWGHCRTRDYGVKRSPTGAQCYS
jgi:hypothetical protein